SSFRYSRRRVRRITSRLAASSLPCARRACWSWVRAAPPTICAPWCAARNRRSPSRGRRRSTTGWRRLWRRATREREPTIAGAHPRRARPIRRTNTSCRCMSPMARRAKVRAASRCIAASPSAICRWRRIRSTRRVRLGGGGERDALVLHQLLKFAGLEHLADDIAAADELALDVELRDGRPLAEFLDALAQLRVDQDVDSVELHTELAQHLDDGG